MHTSYLFYQNKIMSMVRRGEWGPRNVVLMLYIYCYAKIDFGFYLGILLSILGHSIKLDKAQKITRKHY